MATREALRQPDQWTILAVAAASALVAGAAAGFTSGALLPFLIAGLMSALLALLGVSRPDWFLYLVIVSSATARLLQEFGAVGGVTISGSRWAGIWAIALLVVLVNGQNLRVTRSMILYGVFVFWIVARWLTSGLTLVGFKDVVFYSLPPLLGAFTQIVFLRHGLAVEQRLRMLILLSAWIPVALIVLFLPTPLIDFTTSGPRGVLGPRAVSVYVVTALCLAVARHRYAATHGERARAGVASGTLVLFVLATLSRMSSALSLAALLGGRINPRRGRQLIVAGVTSLVIFSGVVAVLPPLRDRFFHRPPTDLATAVQYFDWRGREIMWGLTALRALQEPGVGWGPGSARTYLPRVMTGLPVEGEYHPHNEFLGVFHDLGVIGLIAFLSAWGSLAQVQWRRWRETDGSGDLLLAQWNLASVLMIGVVLTSSLVDNTFHYMPIMSLVFVTIGASEALHLRRPEQQAH